MFKICLAFWKSEPQYAYKRYAYKKKHVLKLQRSIFTAAMSILGRLLRRIQTLESLVKIYPARCQIQRSKTSQMFCNFVKVQGNYVFRLSFTEITSNVIVSLRTIIPSFIVSTSMIKVTHCNSNFPKSAQTLLSPS